MTGKRLYQYRFSYSHQIDLKTEEKDNAMTSFAPRQPKRAKKAPLPAPSSLQPPNSVETPEAPSVTRQSSDAQRQEQGEQAVHVGHSIAHLPVHGPRAAQNEAVLQERAQGETEVTATEIVPAGTQQESIAGLPGGLKSGIETLSGLSMDDVRIHYNSPRPAAVQALAYTQGSEIYAGPGQERHLAHEAWHVVQQKQGRVQPTVQAKGVAINDDDALEREADIMGARAGNPGAQSSILETVGIARGTGLPVQRVMGTDQDTQKKLRLRKLNGELKDGKQLYLLSKTGEVYVEVENGDKGLIVAKTGEKREVPEKASTTALTGSKRSKEEDEGEEGEKMDDDESEERPVKRDKEEQKEEMEDEDAVANQRNFASVAEIFLAAASELHLDEFAELVRKKTKDITIDVQGMLAVVYDMSPGAVDAMSLVRLLQVPLEVASCMDTSAHIFEDTGEQGGNVVRVDQQGKTQKSLSTFLNLLTDDIAVNANQGCVYRVTCKDHSFAVFARNGQVELMQSFANTEHLGANLTDTSRQKIFSPQEFKALMMLMVGDIDEYRKAFELVFGGFFDETYPDMGFYYEKKVMREDNDIMAAVLKRMEGNKAKIENLLKNYRKVKQQLELQAAFFRKKK